jgi:mannose-6-phosphate isomerase-like protein (cupin superfamily)
MKILSAGSLNHGRFEGASDGPASISMILDESEPGVGPRLHRHPYDETWVIQEGNLLFRVGDELGEAGPGDLVLAPPHVPHKFTNRGPGHARVICIHASPTIVGEYLE